jgi:serine/threonine protein kinase
MTKTNGTSHKMYIDGQEIELMKEINNNSFSKVFLGKAESEEVIVKVFFKRKIWKKEKKLLLLFNHPNITSIKKSADKILLFEHIHNGDLVDLIQEKGLVGEKESIRIIIDIFSAIEHIHNKRIAHMNLQPENIIVDKETKIRIGNFEQSISIDEESEIEAKTSFYSPPEIIRGTKDDPMKCDIWSCGIILYCLLTSTLPWNEETYTNEILNNEPPLICYLPSKLQRILKKLLHTNPQNRPTATEAKEMLKSYFSEKFQCENS